MKILHQIIGHKPAVDRIGELEYVGFWQRTWAALIDLILLLAMALAPMQMAAHAAGVTAHGILPDLNWSVSLLLTVSALLLFYLAPGTTPGKWSISAFVLDERTGCPPTLMQQLGRTCGLLLAMIPFGLGFIWIAFQPKKQGWHDKLAGTIVVRQRAHASPLRLGS